MNRTTVTTNDENGASGLHVAFCVDAGLGTARMGHLNNAGLTVETASKLEAQERITLALELPGVLSIASLEGIVVAVEKRSAAASTHDVTIAFRPKNRRQVDAIQQTVLALIARDMRRIDTKTVTVRCRPADC